LPVPAFLLAVWRDRVYILNVPAFFKGLTAGIKG
jgi:hypothetical protein